MAGAGKKEAVLYFVSLVCFGNIIMVNLFIAMVLGSFERASLRSQCKIEQEKRK